MKALFTSIILLAALLGSTPTQAQTKAVPKPVAKPAAKPPVKAAAPAAKVPASTVVKKPATVATAAVTKSAAAAPVAAPTPPVALVTDKMEPPAANTSLLKVVASSNPITGRLTVRTNSPNPTRVEINGPDGRPVITSDLLSSSDVAVLDVSNLPPGAYIVQCTSGERRGIKRVMVGQ
ncbi:T9SS type A sorting domain-containing protein [Hymenobacter tibetensis]|uniref:T9SS type A sorting domain-containing protein n=1 Tax=Hymenobacter tibetensis TaxID=497967 RepID=A0ABY4CXL4_9BACT|nr:T9SS type A sorting domain-containing protein [Hymenobacter tibetensis]UOG74806.1 T9SS type A sorting domain-containing protein [Hymenobacter tibetensis]